MKGTEKLYSVEQIAAICDTTPSTIAKRISRLKIQPTLKIERQYLYSKKQLEQIKEVKNLRVIKVEVPVYIEQTYHIYESKLNSML